MKVSHPERIVFPDDGITKGEVVAYYEQVAAAMLPHVEGRPLTVQRFPQGIGGSGFMQKNAPDHFPESIERIEVPKREGGTTRYPVLHDGEDIAYLANQGTITFHVWTCRAPVLDIPDRIIVDLDPLEGNVSQVREAAHRVRALLDPLGLPTIPVATGSKGYHLVAPVVADESAAALAGAMHSLGIWMAGQAPDLLTAEFRIEARAGRVFVDWLRNRPGQTAVAPWSLRPRRHAPVAMPLTWDEFDDTPPDAWLIGTAVDRLDQPDPLLDLVAHPTDAAPVVEAVGLLLADAGIDPEPFDRFRP